MRELVVKCGPADRDGKRLVLFSFGSDHHRERINTDDAYQRKQARERAIPRLGLDDEAHEELESLIIQAADMEDASGGGDIATLNVVNMADVKTKSVEWFWEPYIPAAAITDLSGDPNEGKSTLAIDLIARNSRGDSMPPFAFPNGALTPGHSLLLSGEDDPERTVKPRLLAAGAIVERVHLLQSATVCDEKQSIQLPMHLPLIERLIVDRKINFWVVDVLAAFTQRGVSLNDDAHMRQLFTPMAEVVQRTGAALLMLRHQNKKENTKAMYRAGGSIAISGASRAAFAVGSNPDDPEEKVFVPIKHNLGPRPHSLTYRIEAHGDSSRIVWGGQTDLTAADVLKGQSESKGSNKTEQAKGIIEDALSDGPRGENEVKAACEAVGISESTYWRARQKLKVQSEKAGFQGEWLLSLPATNGEYHIPFN